MIELNNVTVGKGSFRLSGLNLRLEAGQYGVLTGSSGAGKTTILESICGLNRILKGKLTVDEVDITTRPIALRGIGYVPQDAALFPEMRIEKQIGFGLQMQRTKKIDQRKRVDSLCELLQITNLKKRLPRQLSGGEQQRVAIARALAFRPKLLCLDEPLSAVDGKLRDQLVNILKTVHEVERTTVLHVTHHFEQLGSLDAVKFALADSNIRPVT
jgi:ABC-type Fe3+/spermidine/putrescine transport system ATPase subunit